MTRLLLIFLITTITNAATLSIRRSYVDCMTTMRTLNHNDVHRLPSFIRGLFPFRRFPGDESKVFQDDGPRKRRNLPPLPGAGESPLSWPAVVVGPGSQEDAWHHHLPGHIKLLPPHDGRARPRRDLGRGVGLGGEPCENP